ncbi:inter-alpha-trypsin inhibitor heavy chain H4-like isoform X4 [Tenebrio molitor]|uniref:inter-alpha-trypsin inhibitor heavy chain H4-like isoform X4 n=1 Tax=Tenebrio molitor TaxID=7067 RepID=UPI0036248B64
MKCVFLTLLFICELALSIGTTDINGLVVSTTESMKDKENRETEDNPRVNPQIYSMQIESNVSNRYATTLITSKVRNLKQNAAETTFSVILPENAFISEFEMEINGKVYKAYVKEKEEAKKIYQQAVSSGQSAAHVELSARDSKTFTVSVNIEPESKTIFRLTYEELLQRQIGMYELIINIHPGQTVDDLGVQVNINETKPLTFVKTPSLRTGNEIRKNDDKLDPSAKIKTINSTSAVVKFNPDVSEQKMFAQHLGSEKENGLAGQFVVQYDVERDPAGGEVLVRDGYFVHFFAPSDLKPLQKHVVFVLDHSGSMGGNKIYQLIEAMQNILSELKPNDIFHIIRFADEASVWNITENTFSQVEIHTRTATYGQLEPYLREIKLPEAVMGTKENIEKAKDIIKDKSNMGLTNIIAGLETGLFLIKRTQENLPNKYQPMIIFLTDGLPNVGMSSGEHITRTVTKLNSGSKRSSIFSLSFGAGADKDFLRKLSSQNLGFSRHIYEAADASLQLQDFYKQISSPLLSDINFKYVDGVSDVTKTHYPILFNGSELIVAGRTSNNPDVLLTVTSICTTGRIQFNASRSEPVTSIERLWAYLTVRQILKERETTENKTELTKKALDLALKYSFVTPVSSLVVVKPNRTDSADTENVDESKLDSQGSLMLGSRAVPHYMGPSGTIGGIPGMSMGGAADPYYSGLTGRHRAEAYYPPPPRFQPYVTSTRRSPVKFRTTLSPSSENSTVPQWLEQIKMKNENITTPLGMLKLGQSGDVTVHPECSKTPLNDNTGECTLLYDCPEVFSVLTDINIYFKYFCPLNEFAGVCCPKKNKSSPVP